MENSRMIRVLLLLLCLYGSMYTTYAAFDSSIVCPCASSPASSDWQLTVAEAVRTSDVVLMGRIVNGTLRPGLRNTMNASLLSVYMYKGGRAFWTQVNGVTNFPPEASLERALFFLAKEPTGNLALRCMSRLEKLREITTGDLIKLLEYVRIQGQLDNQENKEFVPPDPDPCLSLPCSSAGSYCSALNTPHNSNHKCICLTGYHGDGYICEPIETPVQCGGVGSPLYDILGNAERCNERDVLGDGCPPLHYCHHGICCPVTPPTSVETHPSPTTTVVSSLTSVAIVTSSSVRLLYPTVSPSPYPDNTGSGSGLEESGSGLVEESGSGLNQSGSGLDDNSGLDESGSGLEESGSGLEEIDSDGSGSGYEESGSGLEESGSGHHQLPDSDVDVRNGRVTTVTGSGEVQEHTVGQLDELETLYDDEDMAYGQWRERRRRWISRRSARRR